MSPDKQQGDANESAGAATIPASISAPKGGGAIRGMGEKFAANPATGTGSFSVPIHTTDGRSHFGPKLSLTYDSGLGNGPFGMGWDLFLPSVTRKTDKGLPLYLDADGSDTFIMSGAEDLVPVLNTDGSRFEDNTSLPGYRIQRYRPRIERSFDRIERWTRLSDGDVHWRSLSKDNVLTIYGKDDNSRIRDPHDLRNTFTWLVSEVRDVRGNGMIYIYKAEDGAGIDLSAAHEGSRGDRNDPRRAVNRYPKRMLYGNTVPLLDAAGSRPLFLSQADLDGAGWTLQVVFDYGEHDPAIPEPGEVSEWPARQDPFSTYRAGFEVRCSRLCRRILMFHHFPQELGFPSYLVRSAEFTYLQDPTGSFISAITQAGYVRAGNGSYLREPLPPLEFGYSPALLNDQVREVDRESLQNLPVGVEQSIYQLVDLDGEGISGILTGHLGAWYYKPPLGEGAYGAMRKLSDIPSFSGLPGKGAHLLDLAGDGVLDLVAFRSRDAGFYKRSAEGSFLPFRTFPSLPVVAWNDPNLRFVDLTGDGRADLMITEEEVVTWYPSLSESGFGPAAKVPQALDEKRGPRLVFADPLESVYLSDLSGDGLCDLVRIRNGEVSYWPNLGYGRFGGRVTMDNSPVFDAPEAFDTGRIRLADIDGSGTTDIIYLERGRVAIYRNRCGNGFGAAEYLGTFPAVDDISSVTAVDLLGSGTACLVWSSPLPAHQAAEMRYVDLMGGVKPHLLTNAANNLGAETAIHYAPSTKFYLADKTAGTPWITKLPFPVQVVQRVETFDRISRNRFVTRYVYHHGHFDGVEREFRGFGLVEQYDTEELAALVESDRFPPGNNSGADSYVPPVLTKTWFHTGIYLGREHVSDYFAGLLTGRDRGEYYREPAWADDDMEARRHLLDDTELPEGLTVEEEREACRALKGLVLREEIYGLDGSDREPHPYSVRERNATVTMLQPRGSNRYGAFFIEKREMVEYQYERNPADARITHTLNLELDDLGNILRSVSVSYARSNVPERLPEQNATHITFQLKSYANRDDQFDWRRISLPVESRNYEVVKPPDRDLRFSFQEMTDLIDAMVPPGASDPLSSKTVPYEQWDWRKGWDPNTEPGGVVNSRLRLIESTRTLYRPDDMGVSVNDPAALLPAGEVQSRALTGESYQLAFTPGLLAQNYLRPTNGPPEQLVPNPAQVLGGKGGGGGGYVDLDGDGHWWIPSGRLFLSPQTGDTALQEFDFARQHFFLPHRFRDQFHIPAVSADNSVSYEPYFLFTVESRDCLGNVSTSYTKDDSGIVALRADYRVLQPCWITDINGNRTRVAFDALGMVVGTAFMGKPLPAPREGDSMDGFQPDLPETVVLNHLADPLADPLGILGHATSRLLYDRLAYYRTKNLPDPQPPVLYTLQRETHDADPVPPAGLKFQHSFCYYDGIGREIQKKRQAEPGPVPLRDQDGQIIIGPDGRPEMTANDVKPRWTGSSWTVYNNKGKPVRKYEPFFTDTHRFEFEVKIGVSPVLFYDPPGRVVVTIHPSHSYEKTVIESWWQEEWDVNDTVKLDPRSDPDIAGIVAGYFAAVAPQQGDWVTWIAQRGVNPVSPPADTPALPPEQKAAVRTLPHAGTPAVRHLDPLSRGFLAVEHNGFRPDNTPILFPVRSLMDIEGNQREVRDGVLQAGDAAGRLVMRYDYDMLSHRIRQEGMESGTRWMLGDAVQMQLRSWDSRLHNLRYEYDPLRRPVRTYVTGADAENPQQELLCERVVYGEQHPQAQGLNLRGKVIFQFDQAGLIEDRSRDFKENLTSASRRLARQYKKAPDWRAVDENPAALPASATALIDLAALQAALSPLLEAETFVNRTSYDAMNRGIQLVAPHSDAPGTLVNVLEPLYNEANLLEQMHAWLNLSAEPAGWLDTSTATLHAVSSIDYDARGQRTRLDRSTIDGRTISTTYQHDPDTFRLVRLTTTRNGETCPLQDLGYTYDPAGNPVYLRDDACQPIYFNGQVVLPECDYHYDPVYRVVSVSGREHIGQVGAPETTFSDGPRMNLPHPGDGQAMRNYLETYRYDDVGNLETLTHQAVNGNWTRSYSYQEQSLIEPSKTGNRPSSTVVGGGPPQPYSYDEHGNMASMPHLQLLRWDYRDQISATSRQAANSGTPETTCYLYDANRQRVRKVTETASGQLKEERIYLGGFEIYRRVGVNALTRETLHVMDQVDRIALVETRIDAGAPVPAVRYQLGNMLGSSCLELDGLGRILSYEEYYVFGSTSYQAVAGQLQAPKRYRFIGKERDEESGLYYFGKRYLAPWLGRWVSADPLGLIDGVNVYAYARDNPVKGVDVTGTDTKSVETKDNYRALLKQAITKVSGKAPSDATLTKLEPVYVKAYMEKDKKFDTNQVMTEFKAKMDLSGRVVVKLKDFKPPGWEAAGTDEEACYKLASAGAESTAAHGESATGGGGVVLYQAVKQRIETNKTASELALTWIRVHIDSGRALIAGVNVPTHRHAVDEVKQPVTDHFIAVYGYEADTHGNVTAVFAKDNAIGGGADIKFNVAADGSINKPKTDRPGLGYVNHEYQLSEVRFHTTLNYRGPLLPKNDANEVMFWPHPPQH